MLKFIKIKFIIAILAVFSFGYASAAPVVFDNLTVLVSSCDKYSIFWPPFFNSLFKQWPSLLNENKDIPILLVANSKSYVDPRVNTINIRNETSWADNILIALEKVNTKYVLIALDDYWISQRVDERRLHEIFMAMQQEDAAMLQISCNDSRYQNGVKHNSVKHLIYTNKYAQYKASLQMAIWDVEALKAILRPNEDPWTFELAGTARSHGYPKAFLSLSNDEPIHYINASYQGHINPNAIKYAQQNRIPFYYGDFPVLGDFNIKLHMVSWERRAIKLFNFIKNPGNYYKFS